jgi:hypothetical protein
MTDKTKYVLELTQAETDKVRERCFLEDGYAAFIYDAICNQANHEYAMDGGHDDYVLELTWDEAVELRNLMGRSSVGRALAGVLK